MNKKATKLAKDFGHQLFTTLYKYGISHNELASILGCDLTMVADSMYGYHIYPKNRFNIILDLLAQHHANDNEINFLNELYRKALEEDSLQKPDDQDEKELIREIISEDFYELTDKQINEIIAYMTSDLSIAHQIIRNNLSELPKEQIKNIFKFIDKCKIYNLDQMAENAGLEPGTAKKGPSRGKSVKPALPKK